MEGRTIITSILKSNDPEKLVIYHAASLENEIRFYINDTQYIAAIENEKHLTIKVDEKKKRKKKNKKTNISIIGGFFILYFISLFYLITIIDNIFVFLIIMNIICFIIKIVSVFIIVTIKATPAVKSKHSAEHMMINFLETNKRLPKNIEEVKKSSRFSTECGSRKLIKGIAENFIRNIVTTIFTFIVSIVAVLLFSSNSVTYFNVSLVTYFLVNFVVGKAIAKYDALNFVIKPIKKALTYIPQCANTTSKVKDSDIILAYFAAKSWLQIVYPEFYNENEDIFWKQYLKVNN